MYKDFTSVNDAQSDLSVSEKSLLVTRLLNINSQYSQVTRSLAQDWARAYSGVIQQEYDENDHITDVTPSNAISTVDSLIQNAIDDLADLDRQRDSILKVLNAITDNTTSYIGNLAQLNQPFARVSKVNDQWAVSDLNLSFYDDRLRIINYHINLNSLRMKLTGSVDRSIVNNALTQSLFFISQGQNGELIVSGILNLFVAGVDNPKMAPFNLFIHNYNDELGTINGNMELYLNCVNIGVISIFFAYAGTPIILSAAEQVINISVAQPHFDAEGPVANVDPLISVSNGSNAVDYSRVLALVDDSGMKSALQSLA